MKKKRVIAILLFILLTTINPHQEISFNKFNLKKIEIENNSLLDEKEIKKLLVSINNKNLIFLKFKEIENALMKNNFIDGFNIKKKYPNTLKIKIFEKKPIAILQNKKEKFYISEKIELFRYENLPNYEHLPYVLGNKKEFNILYKNLIKINFPKNLIEKYILYGSNRWDLEIKNDIVIKLPSKNYQKSLKNFLEIKSKKEFLKYDIFDYRITGQLILK